MIKLGTYVCVNINNNGDLILQKTKSPNVVQFAKNQTVQENRKEKALTS